MIMLNKLFRKTLTDVPQRSDIYLTSCLRLAGTLGWGVIILFLRCPQDYMAQGHTAGSDHPEAPSKTFSSQSSAYSTSCHCLSMSD